MNDTLSELQKVREALEVSRSFIAGHRDGCDHEEIERWDSITEALAIIDKLQAQAAEPYGYIERVKLTDKSLAQIIFKNPNDNMDSVPLFLTPQPSAPAVQRHAIEAEPPQGFIDWLVREMPPQTIIGNPKWWAPKIWRAARDALQAAPQAQDTEVKK